MERAKAEKSARLERCRGHKKIKLRPGAGTRLFAVTPESLDARDLLSGGGEIGA
jgi:hypothetical protein